MNNTENTREKKKSPPKNIKKTHLLTLLALLTTGQKNLMKEDYSRNSLLINLSMASTRYFCNLNLTTSHHAICASAEKFLTNLQLYNPGQKSYAYIEFSKMVYPVGDGPYRIRFWSHGEYA